MKRSNRSIPSYYDHDASMLAIPPKNNSLPNFPETDTTEKTFANISGIECEMFMFTNSQDVEGFRDSAE